MHQNKTGVGLTVFKMFRIQITATQEGSQYTWITGRHDFRVKKLDDIRKLNIMRILT